MGKQAETKILITGCQGILETLFPMVEARALCKQFLVSVINVLNLNARFACCINGILLPSLP